jgi:hypothetical protein
MILAASITRPLDGQTAYLGWCLRVQQELQLAGLPADYLKGAHLQTLFAEGRSPETVAELAYRAHVAEALLRRD